MRRKITAKPQHCVRYMWFYWQFCFLKHRTCKVQPPPSKNKEAQNSVLMIQTAALKSARLAQSNRSRFTANLGSFTRAENKRAWNRLLWANLHKIRRLATRCIQGDHGMQAHPRTSIASWIMFPGVNIIQAEAAVAKVWDVNWKVSRKTEILHE
jgi:hypothetical protein